MIMYRKLYVAVTGNIILMMCLNIQPKSCCTIGASYEHSGRLYDIVTNT